MTIATTVCLPVIRGPVQTAKTLAALDVLSGGRLVVGIGAGSSPRDYAAVGIPFEERWPRFEEAAHQHPARKVEYATVLSALQEISFTQPLQSIVDVGGAD